MALGLPGQQGRAASSGPRQRHGGRAPKPLAATFPLPTPGCAPAALPLAKEAFAGGRQPRCSAERRRRAQGRRRKGRGGPERDFRCPGGHFRSRWSAGRRERRCPWRPRRAGGRWRRRWTAGRRSSTATRPCRPSAQAAARTSGSSATSSTVRGREGGGARGTLQPRSRPEARRRGGGGGRGAAAARLHLAGLCAGRGAAWGGGGMPCPALRPGQQLGSWLVANCQPVLCACSSAGAAPGPGRTHPRATADHPAPVPTGRG